MLKVDADDLARHLSEKYHIEPIVLHEDRIEIADSGDTKVDMSGHWEYRRLRDDEPIMVSATFVEFVIPFSGEADLFKYRPSSCTLGAL
jgi:hypothetical protein